MFKTFDLDENGRITMDEMDRFLRKNNIKMNRATLDEFCESSAALELLNPLSARSAGWTDVRRCLCAFCRRRE